MDKVVRALDRARAEGVESTPVSNELRRGSGSGVSPLVEAGGAALMPGRYEPVSASGLAAKRIVAGQSGHELNDTFAVLRTRVLRQLTDHGFSILMVVSPNPGEGKSTVAANLAVCIAKLSEYSVLLVDADLRRPSVHALFDVTPSPGLTEYLTGNATAAACLVDPGISRLALLPAGQPFGHSAELLAGPQMGRLVRDLAVGPRNRVVILDGPPILASDDAIVLARHVDCGLLVAAEALTPKADVDNAFELLPGLPFVGTVLNRSRDRVRRYDRT